MPSRRQRRRRAKERRHEYEYVYVDEEGREVEVEPEAEERPKRHERRAQPARGGRRIDPPSWGRVGRRALLFGPLMFLTIRLLESKEPIAASLVRTLVLLLLFLPFSYAMDSMLYRAYVRRTSRKT